jgi:CheY-like chemotaxis protein
MVEMVSSRRANPLYRAAPPDGAEKYEKMKVHMPTPWLLIIDDEPEMAEELAELCEASGFSTVTAGNLEPALALLEKHRTIGAIASDLRMPGNDSSDLMRTLVAAVARLDRPCTLMVMTGHAGNAEREHAASLGIHHFFSKPLDTDAFIATLKRVAREPSGGAQAAAGASR